MNTKFLEAAKHYKVLTPMELMYNREMGFLMNNEDVNSFKSFLDNTKLKEFTRLNISTFDTKHMSIKNYGLLFDLIEGYRLMNQDLNKKSFKDRIKSETSHSYEDEFFLKNTELLYKEIESGLKFDSNNIVKLYEIMTKGIIDKNIYKYEESNITLGNIKTEFKSVPISKLEECTDSLVNFINTKSESENIEFIKPFIAQYYIMYLNQFTNYNDEFSRVVAFWLMYSSDFNYPNNFSQIIGANRFMYYRSLQISRKMNNDISYFIEYIMSVLTEDLLCNKNIEHIDQELRANADHLTKAQEEYTKNILIYSKNRWFGWRDYIKFSQVNYSKQGVLKILNGLSKLNILEIQLNTKKEKMFKVNEKYLKYNKKREF